ncbi:MAG TPA: hypothetical protein VJH03_11490 [Blastocatellia bacterium]|nr:hypothetical protein [Blastocatellia bacterium]
MSGRESLLIPLLLAASTLGVAAAQSSAKNEIVPFGHVNGLVPGRSTYRNVIDKMGLPAPAEDADSGDDSMMRYPNRGITIVLATGTRGPATRVQAISVEAPFDGRSPEGLHIGQPKELALRIIRQSWHIHSDLEDSVLVSKTPDDDFAFQAWFEGAKLIKMQLTMQR